MPVICATYLPTNSDQCTTKIIKIITKKQRVKLAFFLLPVSKDLPFAWNNQQE